MSRRSRGGGAMGIEGSPRSLILEGGVDAHGTQKRLMGRDQ